MISRTSSSVFISNGIETSRNQYLAPNWHLKIKPYKSIIYRVLSGVGGIRTLVQTSNTQAFYMLILLLIFELRQRANTQPKP